MLNRLSVNTILKSVFGVLLVVIVCGLATSAWDSYRRVTTAARIAAVADVTTYRDLLGDKQLTAISDQMRAARDAENPPLKNAVIALDKVDFPERQQTVADLAERVRKLMALQEETAAAVLKPKAQRPAGLAQQYFDEST